MRRCWQGSRSSGRAKRPLDGFIEKEKVSLDLDGTVANTYGAMVDVSNERHGTRKRYEDLIHYDFYRILEIDKEEMKQICREVFTIRGKVGKLSCDIPKIVNALRKNFSVYIVTAAAMKREEVLAWLEDNGIAVDGLIFTQNKEEIGAFIYVEDSPDLARRLSAAGKRVVLIKTPYTAGMVDDLRKIPDAYQNIIPAEGWGEVQEIIEREFEKLRRD